MRAATPRPDHVIVFDGDCVLCARSVSFVAARDAGRRFWFTPSGSATARALLEPAGLDATAPGSVVLVEDGRVFTRSEAALRIARHLRGPWAWLRLLRVVPRPVRDIVYDVIARHRYRWFGRRDACALPPPGIRDRLLP